MEILLTVVISVLGTLAVVILVQNLSFPRRNLRYELEHFPAASDPEFSEAMGNVLGCRSLSGNRVRVLSNGVEHLPAMLQSIREARKTITLQNYLWWPGETARQFAEALSERAAVGVRVHVLLDAAGSHTMDPDHIHRMRRAGVDLRFCRPLRWYNLNRLNNRTHRRILVVDGRVGYTGGFGIGDVWQGNADSPEHWRGTQVQVEGPAVQDLQTVFLENWLEVSPQPLFGDAYFASPCKEGNLDCQVFHSGPDEHGDKLWMMYLSCFAAARQRILLANSYFAPHHRAVEALLTARRRHVHIEIIVPGPYLDVKLTRRSSRAKWGALLEGGVELYLFQPTMFHSKYLIIDDCFVSIGSANFDERSFRLNDELNLNVFNSEFARQQSEIFAADKRASRRYTFKEWQNRPLRERAVESLYAIVRSQV